MALILCTRLGGAANLCSGLRFIVKVRLMEEIREVPVVPVPCRGRMGGGGVDSWKVGFLC